MFSKCIGPAIVVLLVLSSVSALASDDNTVHGSVDERPVPIGGIQAFSACITENLQYPDRAASLGMEGRVLIAFVVEKNGSVSDVKIARDAGGGTGKEGLRLVELCSKWSPGKKEGRIVRTQLILPIQFTLE